MKWTLSFEGDYSEDKEEMMSLASHHLYVIANHNAKESIRQRIKNKEISEEEENFLEDLRNTLWVSE